MPGEPAKPLPEPPALAERTAIYIAPDGTVHFGALFEGLLPVARALGWPAPALEPEPPDGAEIAR